MKLFKYLFNSNYRFMINASHGLHKKTPDDIFLKKIYKARTGKTLKLDNPTELSEKLQWLKINFRYPVMTKLADKMEAKNVISHIIDEKYIIPTLGCWNSFDEIDFAQLPEKFILKTTHDSGTHYVCKDKSVIDLKKERKLFSRSLKKNYYDWGREWPYKDIHPRIIAEPLLENIDGSPIVDYKFYCYDGKPQYFMYSLGEVSHNVRNHKFDMNGKSIDYLFKKKAAVDAKDIELPYNLNEMIKIVEVLAEGFPHVRIDLYNINGEIYVGEVTFFSGSGFINIDSYEYSSALANLIDIKHIEKYHNKKYGF